MRIQGFATGAYRENAWLVSDGAAAVLVDPGAEPERLLAAVRGAGASLSAILLTHGHLDHLSALPALLAASPGAAVHVAPGDADWCFTARNALEPYEPVLEPPAGLARELVEGAEIAAGPATFRVLATPGHSPGSVCLLLEDATLPHPVLFSGDTLFAGSIGRTDFEGGSDAAMAASLRRLAALDPATAVLPGHGPATTIGRERAANPYLAR